MNKKGSAIALAAIVLIAGLAAWAILSSSGGDDPEGVTVTDVRGRDVTVPEGITKIVCLSASSVRLAVYMGAGDMIVGVDATDAGAKGSSSNYNYATYRLAYDVKSITNVGSEESFKAIVETGAQLIISSKESADVLDQIQAGTGIPTVGIYAEGSVSVLDTGFAENISLMGAVLGKETRALEIISGVNTMVSELEGYASKVSEKPRCYIGGMFYMMKGGLDMTAGVYVPFDLAGVTNAMPDVNNGNPYTTSIKDIAESGAEYMFIDSMTAASSKTMFDENRSVLSVLPAVKDGRIFSTYAVKYYGTNWEAELMNAYFIGCIVHPDVYSYDADAKMDAVLSLFYPGTGLTTDDLDKGQGPGAGILEW